MKQIFSLISLVICLVLAGNVWAQAQGGVPTDKNLGLKAQIDLGDNTKEILAQGSEAVLQAARDLAAAIGTTAEKIFPYYVKQAFYDGLSSLISCIVFITGCLLLFFLFKKYWKLSVKKQKPDEPWDDIPIALFVLTIITGAMAFVGFLVLCIHGISEWIPAMKNLEYAVVKNFVEDVSKLLPKK